VNACRHRVIYLDILMQGDWDTVDAPHTLEYSTRRGETIVPILLPLQHRRKRKIKEKKIYIIDRHLCASRSRCSDAAFLLPLGAVGIQACGCGLCLSGLPRAGDLNNTITGSIPSSHPRKEKKKTSSALECGIGFKLFCT
jgi:hypothetical protein